MAKQKDNRTPSVKETPASREVRTGGSPDFLQQSSDTKTPAWQFGRIDELHPDWGWKGMPATEWRSILQHLRAFEGMTWAEIKAAAGGRKYGNNSHVLQVTDLVNKAQDRLEEIGIEELDEVFSLRLTQTLRLYGIRDGRVLRLLWHDPHHGTKRGCCPTENTR